MREPATPEPARPDASSATSAAEYDHNDECVGCGAHLSAPCQPTCPFETGVIVEATILRAAVRRLRHHRATVGYHLRSALVATAVDLVGGPRAALLAERTREFLTDFLVVEWGAAPQPMRVLVVYLHGKTADLEDIGRSLYAAAARLDGDDFNAEDFGAVSG